MVLFPGDPIFLLEFETANAFQPCESLAPFPFALRILTVVLMAEFTQR